MTGSVPTATAAGARRRTAPLAAGDLAFVRVELTAPNGKKSPLGTAEEALRDARLTAAERAAVEALVRAVSLLRSRARWNGIDDAGNGVRLVLRDTDAATRGPWATVGSLAISSRNALAARSGGRADTGVLLTVDCAVHELAHVSQFARIPAGVTPHAAILEGVADAAAMLATGDDVLGEEFYLRDADGRYRGAIRDLGRAGSISGPALGTVVTRYADAIKPGVEEHAAGGVVSATFAAVRARLGRDGTEQLLWQVVRDRAAWRTGGSWHDLALALRRAGTSVFPGNPAALVAVDAALAETGLDAALK